MDLFRFDGLTTLEEELDTLCCSCEPISLLKRFLFFLAFIADVFSTALPLLRMSIA